MSDATSSSRKTRSAHTERLQTLKATGSPVTSGKRNTGISLNHSDIWDIIAGAKSKSGGRGRRGVAANETRDMVLNEVSSISAGHHGSSSIKDKGKAIPDSLRPQSTHPGDELLLSRADGRTLQHKRSLTGPDSLIDDSAPPHKKRKVEHSPTLKKIKPPAAYLSPKLNGRVLRQDTSSHTLPIDPPAGKVPHGIPSRTSARLISQVGALPSQNIHPRNTGAHPPQHTVVPESATPSIKRVKLLVRRPPPMISNPRQKPSPPKYGGSLPTFLSSYHSLNDQDVDEDDIERMVHNDVILIDRIEALRQQGRLLTSNNDVLGSTNSVGKSLVVDSKRSPDAWDHIVQAVMVQLRWRRNYGRQISSQIASKIQAYWDGYAARQDKVRLQEEKRLRALAKTTIKLVTSEWKKAVFVCTFNFTQHQGSTAHELTTAHS
jgi:helicase SWR1